MMKIALIFNTRSGKQKTSPEELIRLIESGLSRRKVEAKIDLLLADKYFNNPDQLREDWANHDAAMVWGGDGTVSFAAWQCVLSHKPLCVLPGGSGNGFAKSLGIKKIDDSLDKLAKGQKHQVDLWEISGHKFLSIFGIGLDGIVAQLFKDRKTRGILGYLITSAKTLRGTTGIRMKNRNREGLYEMVVFPNQPLYGFTAKISPKSVPWDGILEMVAVPKLGLIGKMFFGLFLVTGNVFRFPRVRHYREKEFVIELRGQEQFPAHGDGEPFTLSDGTHRISKLQDTLDVFV